MAQSETIPAPARLHLSSHLAHSGPSAISQTMMAVADRKNRGHQVLGLHVGEPDFDTPPRIKQAGIAAILGNDTHYTAMDGSPDVKDAIALKLARDNDLTFTRNEIVVSASAKMMIFMALFATVEPGDEIIIPAPYWGSYIDIAQMLGATPIVIATRPEDGFRLRAEDLDDAITPRTRWLLINSPSNPSGAVYEHQHYAPVLDVVARHPQTWLIADDIYEHLVYDGARFVTPLQVRPGLRDPHPYRQRRIEGLRDDRMADRVRRRPRGAHVRHAGHPEPVNFLPVVNLPGRRRHRPARPAGRRRGLPPAVRPAARDRPPRAQLHPRPRLRHPRRRVLRLPQLETPHRPQHPRRRTPGHRRAVLPLPAARLRRRSNTRSPIRSARPFPDLLRHLTAHPARSHDPAADGLHHPHREALRLVGLRAPRTSPPPRFKTTTALRAE